MKERLQKIIAKSGLASRREAERMIEEGRVKVNGQVIEEQGFQADPDTDHIKVDGKLIQWSDEKVYFLLNKPKGVVTTVSDPEGRITVVDLMASLKHRLFPVGRLDINTEGALLLTNDGDLANKILRPRAQCPKTYLVKVSGVPDEKDLARLQRGMTVDGIRYSRCEIKLIKTGNNSWLTVILHEGKNHQIKNMFTAVGHPVSKLRRIGFAFLSLKGLEPGQFRELNSVEIERLKRGDFQPLQPISPLRTLKTIGVELHKEPVTKADPVKAKVERGHTERTNDRTERGKKRTDKVHDRKDSRPFPDSKSKSFKKGPPGKSSDSGFKKRPASKSSDSRFEDKNQKPYGKRDQFKKKGPGKFQKNRKGE